MGKKERESKAGTGTDRGFLELLSLGPGVGDLLERGDDLRGLLSVVSAWCYLEGGELFN